MCFVPPVVAVVLSDADGEVRSFECPFAAPQTRLRKPEAEELVRLENAEGVPAVDLPAFAGTSVDASVSVPVSTSASAYASASSTSPPSSLLSKNEQAALTCRLATLRFLSGEEERHGRHLTVPTECTEPPEGLRQRSRTLQV